MLSRIKNLDTLRFIAALIVVSGHLLYGSSHVLAPTFQTRYISITTLGSFSVLLFFFISGIALSVQIQRYGPTLKWATARILRLMPMYWITLGGAILASLLLGAKLDYPGYGYFLAALGAQSLFPGISIPPGNPPLWSLSVELILSLGLLLFAKSFVRNYRNAALILTLSISLLTPNYSMFQYLFIFLSGFFCLDWISVILDLKFLFRMAFTFGILIVFFFSSEFFSFANGNFLLVANFFLILSITVPLLTFQNRTGAQIQAISSRAYSLYAVHFPVMYFVEAQFFSQSEHLTLCQAALSLTLVAISTEIAFQFIELPSIRLSRKMLSRNA